MTILSGSLLVLAAFGASFVLTGLVRRWALRIGLMDLPNERSSHLLAVPRGGGVAIVVVVIFAAILLYLADWMSTTAAMVWIVGGSLIAAVGFMDDRLGLSAKIRLAAHFGAAWLVANAVGGLPLSYAPLTSLTGGVIGMICAMLAVTWAINLFNFMDGTDGIAASQATFVAGGGALFCLLSNADKGVAAMSLTVGAASIGFMCWNMPKAKIFMGDIGSGFLGFALVQCAFASAVGGGPTLWTWLILHAAFLCDATVTLLVRLIRGEPVYAAHRQHAYQHLARRWNSHGRVLGAYSMINGLWCLPLAWISFSRPTQGPMLALVATVPLCVAVAMVGAGRAESALK